MYAVRLARGFTGRKNHQVFCCYHGHSDAFLIQQWGDNLWEPKLTRRNPRTAKDTLLAKYNNVDSVTQLFKEPDEIAAIIIEPVAGNMGCIPPEAGFLESLRYLCDQNGALLDF